MRRIADSKTHSLILIFALLLAASLRLLNLGYLPLNDYEAANAINASQLFARTAPVTGGEAAPIYTLLTGFLFAITAASDFTARLLPALAGLAVVFLPLCFKRYIGPRAAYILVLLAAVDPISVALSRTADAGTFSVAALLAFAAALSARRPVWASVMLGLGLISGAFFWYGLVVALLFLITMRLFSGHRPSALLQDVLTGIRDLKTTRKAWFTLALVVGLLGTYFLVYKHTWQMIFGGFLSFLSGFLTIPVMSLGSYLLTALPFLALSLTLGVISLIDHWSTRERKIRPYGILWLIGFALLILYGARSLQHTLWMALPLYILGAQTLAAMLYMDAENRLSFILGASIVTSLLVFIYLDAIALLRLNTTVNSLHLAALAGGLILIALVIVLVLWGWSLWLGELILAVSLLTIATLNTISLGHNLSGMRELSGAPEAAFGQVIRDQRMLPGTLRELSNLSARSATGIDMVTVGLDRPSLTWALKDFTRVSQADAIGSGTNASIYITSLALNPNTTENYRGQGFVWSSGPAAPVYLLDWLKWLFRGELPKYSEGLILWANTSLFPE